MNVYDRIARLVELKNEYKSMLAELDSKASFYYSDDQYHDAWLIVQTQYETISKLVEQMEAIFNAE